MPGAAITLDLDRLELRDAGGARVALRRQAMAVLHCLACQPEPFLTGLIENNEHLGRLVDVLVIKDGSLLVSDDHNGAIYRISFAGK